MIDTPPSPFSETISIKISRAVRRKIMYREPGFEPGQRLLPGKLALDLGVSDTPVKEALKVLAQEGLLTYTQRRGYRVMELSEQNIREIMSLYRGLQTMALEMVQGPIPQEMIVEIADAIQNSEVCLEEENFEGWIREDWRYHNLILSLPGNELLGRLAKSLQNMTNINCAYSLRRTEDLRISLAEHKRFFQALQSGDLNQQRSVLAANYDALSMRALANYRAVCEVLKGIGDTPETSDSISRQAVITRQTR